MLIGAYIEERRLVRIFGEQYLEYRRQVSAFIPRLRRPPTVPARKAFKSSHDPRNHTMAGTSPMTFWELLERVFDYFYDPAIFWGVPLFFTLLWEVFRRKD
ncbi:MAG: hypothetical protein ACE5I0_06905 [Candidatus Binatia bacterium]